MTEMPARRAARNLHMLSALTRRVLESDFASSTGADASFTQIVILKWLDTPHPRRAQDVARYLSTTAPAATQILARLKKKGLIRSQPSPEDGRAEDLYLTRAARTLVKQYEEQKLRRLERLLEAVPEPKRKAMMQGLEAAIDVLLQDGGKVEGICLHCGAYGSSSCVMRQHGYVCPTEAGGPARSAIPAPATNIVK